MPNGRKPPQVSVDAWNDTIHIIPERLDNRRDVSRRRIARLNRMERSPTPEIVQATQQLLTEWDDIQDGFVTLAMFARLGAAFYPPAARIAGWLATGADVMNAPTALARPLLMSKAAKRDLVDKFSHLPNTYRRRLKDSLLTRKWNPKVTEWAQVAQTTDTIFGVGVSLGAAMSLPIAAAALSVTGGELVTNVFPFDEALMKEYLGPWQKSARLRSNPPLREQVERAKVAALDFRRQEINAYLRRPKLPGASRARLERLQALPNEPTPEELAQALTRDTTLTMPTFFGIPDLREHFFPPEQTMSNPEVLRELRASQERQRQARGVGQRAPAPGAGAEETKAFVEGLIGTTSEAIRAAAGVLGSWKRWIRAKDDLTSQEHVDMVAALNLAWRTIGPWFSFFGYDIAGADSVDHLQDGAIATESLNTWGARIEDNRLQDFAKVLVADTAGLMIRYIDSPNVGIEESLTPLAAAAVALTESGAYSTERNAPGAPRIDPRQARAMVGPRIWGELADGERQLVEQHFQEKKAIAF